MRGGSLERDKPTFLLTYPGSPPLACFGTPSEKRMRVETALVVSRQERGNPWRAENPTRGSAPIVRLTPADWSTDSRNGLKPLKARPKPTAFSHTTLKPLFGAVEDDGW